MGLISVNQPYMGHLCSAAPSPRANVGQWRRHSGTKSEDGQVF